MTIVKGIYKDGKIELTEHPFFSETVEVYVIFTQKIKKIIRIEDKFKNVSIDYDRVRNELKQLSQNSTDHLLEELDIMKNE